jgi:hypothetical protein
MLGKREAAFRELWWNWYIPLGRKPTTEIREFLMCLRGWHNAMVDEGVTLDQYQDILKLKREPGSKPIPSSEKKAADRTPCHYMLYDDDGTTWTGHFCPERCANGWTWCQKHTDEVQIQKNPYDDPPPAPFFVSYLPIGFRDVRIDVCGYFEHRWREQNKWECSFLTMDGHIKQLLSQQQGVTGRTACVIRFRGFHLNTAEEKTDMDYILTKLTDKKVWSDTQHLNVLLVEWVLTICVLQKGVP